MRRRRRVVRELLARAGRVGSLRVRITVLATVITAVAVVLSGWLLLRSVESTQATELHDLAERSVALVSTRLAEGAPYDDALVEVPSVVVVTDEDGRCLTTQPGGVAVRVSCVGGGTRSTEDDRLIGRSDATADESSLSGSLVAGEGVGSVGPGFVSATSGTPETVTQEVDSPEYGHLTITAMTPADEIARSVASVRRALWLVLPALVAVVGTVTWLLLGRTLGPVEAIRREAEAIGATSLHRRVPEPRSDDEIGRLARTMNRMLDRLEGSARRQQQFVSDASHELRTPVTAIRTDLEVALAEGGGADWPTVARAVLTEDARLETVISDLLVLATDDEDGPTERSGAGPVDLDTLVAEEAARTRPVPVTASGPGLDRPASPAPVVTGSAPRLQRALANLLDNACRHARERVEVALSATATDVRVDVDDDGPGIEPADRERIFERFTRLDDGRARDKGGAGLGLAVVRSIVVRHGGTVSVSDSPLGGARFRVVLPRASRTTPQTSRDVVVGAAGPRDASRDGGQSPVTSPATSAARTESR
jgi:signal transduction histidine kinase